MTSFPLALPLQGVWGSSNVKLGLFLPGQAAPTVVVKGNVYSGSYYGFLGDPKQGGQKILSVVRHLDARGFFTGDL